MSDHNFHIPEFPVFVFVVSEVEHFSPEVAVALHDHPYALTHHYEHAPESYPFLR